MEAPNYERKVIRVRSADVTLPPSPWKVLFVEGFSECGVEFHLHSLLKQPWPTQERYLYAWNRDQPGEFAKVLEQNSFKMVVIAGWVGSWEYQYGNKREAQRHQQDLSRVEAALKTAVEQKGATLVLFCTEKTSYIYSGLFGKRWREGTYVRTSAFKTPAAAAVLPPSAPQEVNAKAILLEDVPAEESWYATTGQSANNSLLDRPDLRPGLASIAVGAAGQGRVMYVGDVNAEAGSSTVVAQLAAAMFAAQPAACANCGAESGQGVELKRCARCKQARYCGPECQAAAWPLHKRVCAAAT